jgi:hypothetical protein
MAKHPRCITHEEIKEYYQVYGPETFYWKSIDAILMAETNGLVDIARKILREVIDKQQSTAMVEYWASHQLMYLLERCADMRQQLDAPNLDTRGVKRVAIELMIYGKLEDPEARARFVSKYERKSLKKIRRPFERPDFCLRRYAGNLGYNIFFPAVSSRISCIQDSNR